MPTQRPTATPTSSFASVVDGVVPYAAGSADDHRQHHRSASHASHGSSELAKGSSDASATRPSNAAPRLVSPAPTASPPPPAAEPPERRDARIRAEFRQRVHDFFHHYSPQSYHEVEGLANRFWDRQEDLMSRLRAKYGPDPPKQQEDMSTVARLQRFFRKYDPSLIDSVPKIMDTYGGHDHLMWKVLTEKYGRELTIEESNGPNGTYRAHKDLLSRLQRFFSVNDVSKLARASDLAREYEFKDEEQLRATLRVLYNGAELELDPGQAGREAREAEERAFEQARQNEIDADETRKWLVVFMSQQAPKRMREIEQIVSQWTGKHSELKSTITALFGKFAVDYNTPRQRLLRMYHKYSPGHVEDVDKMLSRFAGRVEEMFAHLTKQFGPEPAYDPEDEAVHFIMQQENQLPAAMSQRTRKRLQLFFLTYDAKLASSVDHVMTLFRGNELEMWHLLTNKYGPEPAFVDEEEEARKRLAEDAARANKIVVPDWALTRSFRERVVMMYNKYNAAKLHEIDRLLNKYAGRDADLMRIMTKKYGKEPPDPRWRERIFWMYRHYNPGRLEDLPRVFTKYEEQEEELLAMLVAKYGAEPESACLTEVKAAFEREVASNIAAAQAWRDALAEVARNPTTVRSRITRMYQAFNATRIGDMTRLLDIYAGREEELLELLVIKHGAEPDEDWSPGSPTGAMLSPLNSSIQPMTGAQDDADGPDGAGGGGGGGGGSLEFGHTLSVRERVRRFYAAYNPDRLADVDTVMQKFAGREQALIEMLLAKYGPEPGA